MSSASRDRKLAKQESLSSRTVSAKMAAEAMLRLWSFLLLSLAGVVCAAGEGLELLSLNVF